MDTSRRPCSVCGKICRGEICLECRKKHIQSQEICPVCGGKKSHMSSICVDCYNKQRAQEREERLEEKKESAPKYKCLYCGKEIKWDHTFGYRIPKYCSSKCAGHAEKPNHPLWHTKEEVTKKIHDAIDETGLYITHEYLNKVLHITDKVMKRLKLSLVAINAEKGKTLSDARKQDADGIKSTPLEKPISKSKLKRGRTLGTKIVGGIQIPWKSHKKWTKEELETTITSYIKVIGRPVTFEEASDHLGIDYTSFRDAGVSIPEINEKAGYPQTTGKSIYEHRAFDILGEIGVGKWEQSKSFSTLKSSVSGKKMLVDLYNEELETIVEIDGPEHYKDSRNADVIRAHIRDKEKEEWARKNHLFFFRIKTEPYDTFDERVRKLVKILKILGERKNTR